VVNGLAEHELFLLAGDLVRLPKGAAIPVTLKVLEFELYTVTPIKVRTVIKQ